MLVDVHRDPAVKSILRHGAVARTINSLAERLRAARERGAFLEKVKEVNGPAACDLMRFVRHALGRQCSGKLASRAAKPGQIELEQIKEVTVTAAGRHSLG